MQPYVLWLYRCLSKCRRDFDVLLHVGFGSFLLGPAGLRNHYIRKVYQVFLFGQAALWSLTLSMMLDTRRTSTEKHWANH